MNKQLYNEELENVFNESLFGDIKDKVGDMASNVKQDFIVFKDVAIDMFPQIAGVIILIIGVIKNMVTEGTAENMSHWYGDLAIILGLASLICAFYQLMKLDVELPFNIDDIKNQFKRIASTPEKLQTEGLELIEKISPKDFNYEVLLRGMTEALENKDKGKLIRLIKDAKQRLIVSQRKPFNSRMVKEPLPKD